VRNDGVVVSAMNGCPGLFSQRGGFRRILIGNRDEADRRMPGRKSRTQPADATAADDGQTYGFAIDDPLRFGTCDPR